MARQSEQGKGFEDNLPILHMRERQGIQAHRRSFNGFSGPAQPAAIFLDIFLTG
jgi:hypothetical protein